VCIFHRLVLTSQKARKICMCFQLGQGKLGVFLFIYFLVWSADMKFSYFHCSFQTNLVWKHPNQLGLEASKPKLVWKLLLICEVNLHRPTCQPIFWACEPIFWACEPIFWARTTTLPHYPTRFCI